MKVFTDTREAARFLFGGCALTVGNYDGVHIGHRAILEKLVGESRKRRLKPVVLTFSPHPVKVLAPGVAPRIISTDAQKTELIAACGVNTVILQRFDAAFAHTGPEDFFHKRLLGDLRARYVIVGYDFTFGRKRGGTTETLEALGLEAGIAVEIVPARLAGNTLVSSSLIRRLVAEGNVREAARLLARGFFIDGTVVRGHKRGTALGIHTANLETRNELLPKDGVYATRIVYAGRRYDSVTNVGFNPTFNNAERSIETHILGFAHDIYGKSLRLEFVERLREEIKFASPEALVKQIALDIKRARKILRES